MQEFDINEAAQGSYGISIPELLKNMEVLNSEFQKIAGRMDVILRSMPGVLCGLKGAEQDRIPPVSEYNV